MNESRIVPSTPSRLAPFAVPVPAIAPVPLHEHLGVVSNYRWLIVAVALTVSLGGAVYAYSKAPLYEGNLLLSVPNMRASEQRDLLGGTSMPAARQSTMSESELLRSRMVLAPVVDKLRLDIRAEPVYLPVVGRAVASWNAGRHAWPAVGGYAWGRESITVGAFEVAPALRGASFSLTKLPEGRFRLEEKRSGFRAYGQVGRVLHGTLGGHSMALRVERLTGGTGARFSLQKLAAMDALADLLAALTVSELGKDSGMLNVSMRDVRPEQAKAVLNAIGVSYMDFVRRQKDERFLTSLAVLKAQVPVLERRVAAAEKRVEDFRRAQNTADLTEETRLALARQSATQSTLAELRQKHAEMSTRLGEAHPQLLALEQQMLAAQREGNTVARVIGRTPSLSTELERRARDLQVETEIQRSVLRKIEELQVLAQDRSTNVRIVDEAVVPVEPVGSRKLILGFFMLVGIFLGLFAAFLRHMLSPRRAVDGGDGSEAEPEPENDDWRQQRAGQNR